MTITLKLSEIFIQWHNLDTLTQWGILLPVAAMVGVILGLYILKTESK